MSLDYLLFSNQQLKKVITQTRTLISTQATYLRAVRVVLDNRTVLAQFAGKVMGNLPRDLEELVSNLDSLEKAENEASKRRLKIANWTNRNHVKGTVQLINTYVSDKPN